MSSSTEQTLSAVDICQGSRTLAGGLVVILHDHSPLWNVPSERIVWPGRDSSYLQNPVSDRCHYLPPVLTLPGKVVCKYLVICSQITTIWPPHLLVLLLVSALLCLVPVQVLHQLHRVQVEIPSIIIIVHTFKINWDYFNNLHSW